VKIGKNLRLTSLLLSGALLSVRGGSAAADTSSEANPAATGSAMELQTITVTAQKRAEKLQKQKKKAKGGA